MKATGNTTKLRTKRTKFNVHNIRGEQVFEHMEQRTIRCATTNEPIKRLAQYLIRQMPEGWRIRKTGAYGIGEMIGRTFDTNTEAAAWLEGYLDHIADNTCSLGMKTGTSY